MKVVGGREGGRQGRLADDDSVVQPGRGRIDVEEEEEEEEEGGVPISDPLKGFSGFLMKSGTLLSFIFPLFFFGLVLSMYSSRSFA